MHVNFINIPPQLRALESFLLWKNFSRGCGKMIKSPVSSTGFKVAYNNPDALMHFDTAKERFLKTNDCGLGVSLLDGLEVTLDLDEGFLWCLDFDGFADPNSSNFDDGVTEFIHAFPSYTEISPSGTGFKYFFVCDRPPQRKFKIKFGPSEFASKYSDVSKYSNREVEVFSCNLFLALTGKLFSESTAEIKFLSGAQLDDALQQLNAWAETTGGSGTTDSLGVAEKSISTSPNVSYSKLTKSSLKAVLACVDHTDYDCWVNAANLLARVYGEEGRKYFLDFSKGDYCGIPYEKFMEAECDEKFSRALVGLQSRPNGYGIRHLLSMARKNFGWSESYVEYESNFGFPVLSSEECISTIDMKHSAANKVEKIPSSIDRMDIRNAERFRENFCETLRFVRDTGDILHFDPDKGWGLGNSDLPMQSAKAVVAKMASLCAEAMMEGKDVKSMLSEVKRSSSRRALEDMIKLARSEPGMSVALSELDNDPYLLGVNNGVVDLRKGLLLPPNPNLLVTKYCNIEFNPKATCPRFCAFLEQISPIKEQRNFLVLVLAYFLTGLSREQLWFFFHGIGSNGKSVLITLLETLLGDYATKIPTDMLMQQYRSSGGAAPDLLLLQGKRLVFCNETKEGQRIDDARLKDLTGGDTIIGRPLYSNKHISFAPTHKLVVVGNYHPTVSDDSHGFWRRVVLYPFSVCIPQEQQDKRLLEKLILEGPGILNYLLEALKVYFANGLTVPEILSTATNKYRTEQDTVQQFLNDECTVAHGMTISRQNLYSRYASWCSLNGLQALSSNRLSRKLTAKGFTLMADKRTWMGVG